MEPPVLLEHGLVKQKWNMFLNCAS